MGGLYTVYLYVLSHLMGLYMGAYNRGGGLIVGVLRYVKYTCTRANIRNVNVRKCCRFQNNCCKIT